MRLCPLDKGFFTPLKVLNETEGGRTACVVHPFSLPLKTAHRWARTTNAQKSTQSIPRIPLYLLLYKRASRTGERFCGHTGFRWSGGLPTDGAAGVFLKFAYSVCDGDPDCCATSLVVQGLSCAANTLRVRHVGSIPRTPTLKVLAAQQDLAFCFVYVKCADTTV